MPHYTTEDIKNIALVGQNNVGKTTLTERMLLTAGSLQTEGSVEKGNTITDFLPLEKEHGHSLAAAIASLDYDGKHINIIDAPGMPDFMGQAMSVFPAVETVGIVLDAAAGIEMISRRLLDYATERKLCRVIIINKIDQPELDLPGLLEQLKEAFGSECLPLNLPTDNGNRVVDCFFNPDGDSDFSSVADAHTQIIDQVVEVDEDLMNVYLEQGQELEPEQLHDPFEKALREGHLIPVCFVSSKTGAGIPELMDIFTRLLPNPLEGNPRPFLRGEGDEATPFFANAKPEDHAIAHVFKVSADPFLGKLGLFRIHQGTITKDSQLFIGDGRKPFKVNHLFKLQGKEQIEMMRGIPGDICAVAKVDNLHFDAVLHDSHDEDYLHLKPLLFPRPMYGLAITPKRQGDESKISTALHKLVDEDPCLQLEYHAALNETVLRGLGELHLRVALEKMTHVFNVEVETQPPKIPYRETVSQNAEGHHRHKKQSGGAGQFGEVSLKIEPLARGAGFEFVDAITGGVIPGQFLPAVEKGVRQALDQGAIAGYPIEDVKVTVFDGKHHSVDSKEVAFIAAGKKAFLDAVSKAKPLVLEPMVQAEITIPESAMGNIAGDLSSKRGRIMGNDMQGQMVTIKAEVPLAELSNYPTELKSATGGHGFFTMELSHYEPVPPPVQQQIMAAYKPTEEEN